MTSLEGRRSQVMLNLMFVSGTIATTEDYDVKEMVPLRSWRHYGGLEVTEKADDRKSCWVWWSFRNHNNNKVMPSSKRFFESENVYMVLNGQTGECRELQFFFSASPSSYSFCIHVLRVISQISQSKNSKLDIGELTRTFFAYFCCLFSQSLVGAFVLSFAQICYPFV